MSIASPPIVDQVGESEVREIRGRSLRFLALNAIAFVVIFGCLLTFFSFINLDGAFMEKNLAWIALGVPMTLAVSAASILLAVLLALVGALGRLSRNPIFYAPATFYVSLIRGTPLIIQVFFWYLALPQIKVPVVNIVIPGIMEVGPGGFILQAVPAGILALAVCYGAYMAETFRAGIQSISKGQTEAALALGMTRMQTMREIILPQAFRIIIPPIGNEFIAMTKDSSLVSFMGVWELRFRADKIGRQSYRNFETLIIAAVLYWIMQIFLQYIQGRIEASLAKGDR